MSGETPGPAPSRTAPARRASGPARRERRVDIDWLRTLIVLVIIPYHALFLFTVAGGTVIRRPAAAPWTPSLYLALEDWGIPFIFLLAGAASGFALASRSLGAFARERALRLLVPAALVAVLFAPVRAYYLALANPALLRVSPVPITDPEGMRNIGVFFLEYWRILFTTGSSIVSRNPLAHLWFVPRLLVVSLVCALPLRALGERWPRWVERMEASGLPPAALALGGGLIPAAVVVALEPGWLNRLTAGFPLYDYWPAFFLCLIWFIYGYLIYASAGLRKAARDLAFVTLALALAGWGITLGIMLSGHAPAADYSPVSMLYTLTRVYAMWLLTLAALGLGARYLNVASPWQRYLTAAAFPVYILHLPLLLPAAYYLQYLPAPWPLQLALAIVVSLGGAFALYEYVVRRTPGVRTLFGLGAPRPAHARPPDNPPAPLAPA